MLGTKKLSTKVNQSNSIICEKIATSVLAETDKNTKIQKIAVAVDVVVAVASARMKQTYAMCNW